MNVITKMSLLCSLAGLAALYVGAVQVRPSVTAISRLDNDFLGLKVIISGRVVDLRQSNGHMFLTLKDESGGLISVPIFSGIRSQLSSSIELLDIVQVTGVVKEYNGELEVLPETASDIVIVHSPCASVSGISEDNLGELVKVRGVVAEREIVGRGNIILTLHEDGGELPVFVPASMAGNSNFPEVHVGYTVQTTGWLQLYDNELELRLKDASSIEVIEAA